MGEQNIQQTQTAGTDSELTLEEAFAQIETVLRQMEQPGISLSGSLAAYERGIALLRLCNEQIDRVEKQMITLRTDAAGGDTEEA